MAQQPGQPLRGDVIDGNGVHAPNERVRVRSVYEGREFLYRLLKLYTQAK